MYPVENPKEFELSRCVLISYPEQIYCDFAYVEGHELIKIRDMVTENMEPPGKPVLALSIASAKRLVDVLQVLLRNK